jgi:hypothetical protein
MLQGTRPPARFNKTPQRFYHAIHEQVLVILWLTVHPVKEVFADKTRFAYFTFPQS